MFGIKSLGGTFKALQMIHLAQKNVNSMHALKSAILAILPEIGQLAGLACPVSAALLFRL